MPAGRPTKLTARTAEAIVECLRRFAYRETASARAGLSKETFYAWLKRGARAQGTRGNEEYVAFQAAMGRFTGARARALKADKDPIPALAAVRDRQAAGPGAFCAFVDAVERAEAEAEMGRLDQISTAAEGGQWQAAAWQLERKHPKRYGRVNRLDVSAVEDGEEVDISFTIRRTPGKGDAGLADAAGPVG